MIDLQKFCSETRKSIARPWSRGEYSYATNGHVIIRVPAQPDVPENTFAPDAERPSIFGGFSCSGKESFPIPDLPTPKWAACDECLGESRAAREQCEECGGTGKVRDHQNVEIGGMFFADVYLELIKDLPGLKFYPVKYEWITGGIHRPDPSPFTFDGGDGLLMPVKTS